MSEEKALWKPINRAVIIPPHATPQDVVKFASAQLSPREIKSIANAYSAGDYEMMGTFVWAKAVACLRKQLASLGMDFIGEMLGRADISPNSSIEESVTEYQLIQLAEDLGMISRTEAMRLRHTHEVITHFVKKDSGDTANDQEQMLEDEARLALRACVQSILAQPKISVALKFAEFRKALEEKSFSTADHEITMLSESPYLYQRTTLSVLLALAKSAEGGQLDNSLSNLNTILPCIWDQLLKPERWQVGQTYAEVYANGQLKAAAGIKKALAKVQGFDYVPENLRSIVFSKAAQRVLEAHDGWNNFFNEPAPMEALASLGSSVPLPAFPIVMSATLAVRLGNGYGVSNGAQAAAVKLLQSLSQDRWEYYLSDCLPDDKRILEKLAWSPAPVNRWLALVAEYKLARFNITARHAAVKKLINASDTTSVKNAALALLSDVGYV